MATLGINGVTGSFEIYAAIAQVVEHRLGKTKVNSANLFCGSSNNKKLTTDMNCFKHGYRNLSVEVL